MSAEERFWAKVDKSGDCWIWTAATSGYPPFSYGRFLANGRRGKHVKAHRYAYSICVGPIPDGMLVCHRCDVPLCVNPAHLFIGTKADNNRDRCLKGRNGSHKGANNGRAKLQPVDISDIRLSSEPSRELAARYGVAQTHINRIRSGVAWSHVA